MISSIGRLRNLHRLSRFAVILLLLIILAACSSDSVPPFDGLHIEPVDLFEGEAKKFEPFFGGMFGAVKVKYHGKRNAIQANLEIWENGEKRVHRWIGGALTEAIDDEQYIYDGEFIVSVSENNDEEQSIYSIRTATVDQDGGYSSFQFQIEAEKKHGLKQSLDLYESVQVGEGEEVAVWGMQAVSSNAMRTGDLSEEILGNAEWAIVFKLYSHDE